MNNKPKSKKNTDKSKHTKLISKNYFAKIYALCSVFILIITTTIWALLGAKVQQNNADQLVDPYLFASKTTFKNATIPGQHTFLLKWPLFELIRLLNFKPWIYTTLTVCVVVVTVLIFVACLYFINRRFIILGTLYLALASVLMLVPAQPYSGALLPVNMAMLTTRNIEYIFFIISLILFIKVKKLRSWTFIGAVALLSLLIASDKLFLTLSLGASLTMVIIYAFYKRWELVTLSINWLIGSILAIIGSTIILAIINFTKVTHISNQAGTGPYGLVQNLHSFIIGTVFAGLGLLTNFGANISYGATTFRGIAHNSLSHVRNIGEVSLLINLVIFIFSLFIIFNIFKRSISAKKTKREKNDKAQQLAVMILLSSCVAVISFILTNHYYAVDARYLTISVFAIFISGAVYFKNQKYINNRNVLVVAGILILSIGLGIVQQFQTTHQDQLALSGIQQRNETVGKVIKIHSVKTLIGDYWRVVPIKFTNQNIKNIIPLSTCTQPREDLNSTAFQTKQYTQNFAYLLSSDKSLTDYPTCNLAQVVKNYGKPNASALIAGSLDKPQEQLLFYDNGVNDSGSKNATTTQNPATVEPISLDQLPNTHCDSPTIVSVVAHEDDDLLFMNPDIYKYIKDGYCIRTIYMTAGDAGNAPFYWLSREHGSQAAYAAMTGDNSVWIQRIVKLGDNQFITVANPKGNSKISLIYFHLPDGNLFGQGFSDTNFQSLAKLFANSISTINSVDGQSHYTLNQLISNLSNLFTVFAPTQILTQSTYIGSTIHDHSDHINVGRLVVQAHTLYENQQFNNLLNVPMLFYLGYTVREHPPNLSNEEISMHQNNFLTYSKYDSAACQNLQECSNRTSYQYYFQREYQNSY